MLIVQILIALLFGVLWGCTAGSFDDRANLRATIGGALLAGLFAMLLLGSHFFLGFPLSSLVVALVSAGITYFAFRAKRRIARRTER